MEISALLDTGAEQSLLRLRDFVIICATLKRKPILKPAPEVTSLTGQPIPAIGVAEIEEEKVGPLKFIVVKDMTHPAILGWDLLQQTSAQINVGENTINWRGQPERLFTALGVPTQTAHFHVNSLGSEPPVIHGTKIRAVVLRNADVFSSKAEPNGKYPLTEMVIDTGDHPPIRQRAYRAAFAKRQVIEEEVQKMLKDGVIRPSSSPWASPVTLVPKKSGETRFCIDFRRINAITKKDSYPLPLIQDIFDQLGDARIFSTLDLKSGYWQLPIHPLSMEKTAFICHLGLYEFTRIPFGLANAPAVFQRAMNTVLAGLLGKTCMVYLDDIVIFSKTEEEHERHLEEVFSRLRQAGLRLKPKKCYFGLKEIQLLGYIISQNGIRADPEKTQAIASLRPPTDVKGVRSFLGMAGYYRQCVPDFAKVAEPLHKLLRKNTIFEWGADQQGAFDKLKELLTSDSVMTRPRPDQPYKLYTDACDYAVGAILVQTDEQGVERVIQYLSHQLHGAQRRWAAIEKEAYAVVYALEKLRPYLYGASFTVYTDHKPLTSLFTKQMANTKIQRWSVLLAEYGAKIEYRKGPLNVRADMLSRIRQPEVAVLDTDEWFDAGFPEESPEDGIPWQHDELDLQELQCEQKATLSQEYDAAQDPDSDYILCKGLLYSTRRPSRFAAEYPRLVLPPSVRERIIKRSHADVGHLGPQKTLDRVREAYVWPGMKAEIRCVVRKCPTCLLHASRRERVPPGEMPSPCYPMQVIGADLIGPLMTSPGGKKYILTVIDHFTGWAEAYPLTDKTNAKVWNAFSRDYFPRHGYPEILITDNGLEFCAKPFEYYLKELGVQHRKTTPYHPQSNGKTERFNRTLKTMLTRLVHSDRATWESQLGPALTAYRNTVSEVTGHTPFHLLYGRRARLPLTRMLRPLPDGHARPFGSRLEELHQCWTSARALNEQSRRANRERLERKAHAQHLEVGDSVIVALQDPQSMSPRWSPQWEIYKKKGTTYWIKHQLSGQIRRVHREKLRLVDPETPWDSMRATPVKHPLDRVEPPEFGEEECPIFDVSEPGSVSLRGPTLQQDSHPDVSEGELASPSHPYFTRSKRHRAPFPVEERLSPGPSTTSTPRLRWEQSPRSQERRQRPEPEQPPEDPQEPFGSPHADSRGAATPPAPYWLRSQRKREPEPMDDLPEPLYRSKRKPAGYLDEEYSPRALKKPRVGACRLRRRQTLPGSRTREAALLVPAGRSYRPP